MAKLSEWLEQLALITFLKTTWDDPIKQVGFWNVRNGWMTYGKWGDEERWNGFRRYFSVQVWKWEVGFAWGKEWKYLSLNNKGIDEL